MVDVSIIVMGDSLVIRWMRYNKSFPAQDYLQSLGSEIDRIQARLLALTTMMAESGRLPSTQHGHYLKSPYSEIFEFKPFGHRFFAFVDGTTMYLTNGAPKRAPKAQQGDYKQAAHLRADYFAKKKPKKGEKK